MRICVGDDWAEAHHDIWVMDTDGGKLASRRLPEGAAGIAALHELIGGYTDDPAEVVIGIETDRGLWVQALVAAGYTVYAINPLAVSRYRDRHTLSGAKSDPGDAKVLADLVRTDAHNHRPIAGDSAEVEALKVLARAHQTLIWARTRHTNTVRSTLREYYPAALQAFDDLAHPDAIAVLGYAPSPAAGRKLTAGVVARVLKRAGRRRNLEQRAAQITAALRGEQLDVAAVVAEAFAAAVTAQVAIVATLNEQIDQLHTMLADRFDQHPDAVIYRSLPGLGDVLGARVLAEFGDDPERYDTAKSRKNYAGTSPITRASGRSRVVLARHARPRRLFDAIDQWAFCSLTQSAGCRTHYDRRRAAGDTHHQALRNLGNRLVGILHGCLTTHTSYDEHTAWAHRANPALAA